MDEKIIEILHTLLNYDMVSPDAIPNIELYMDQITTFMEKHLGMNKRYDDDKIMTKTMINNYTKNHLLPPSYKKKYSREHIIFLIMIYYYKNVLSISDIQNLLSPLSENYFPENPENGISLTTIYSDLWDQLSSCKEESEAQIMDSLKRSQKVFEHYPVSGEAQEELERFAFVSQLCLDIFLRKQLIERLIDQTCPNNNDKKKK